MDMCTYILEQHNKSEKENEKIFNIVLKEFFDNIELKNNFDIEQLSTINQLELLKLFYKHEYIDILFKILNEYNYNMVYEIKDAIFYLGNLKEPNKNKTVIKKLLNSPIIQDISFDGESKYTILSDKYGKFEFELAKYHFQKNNKISKYIENNILPNHCHENVFFLSNVIQDYYSITSLCSCWFKGDYYHSYTYNQCDDKIIDLCNNSIMDKNQYYKLFEPSELSIILNSNVWNEYVITKCKTEQPIKRCKLLQIALYKQYLNSIGYQGTLSSAPTAIKKYQKIPNKNIEIA